MQSAKAQRVSSPYLLVHFWNLIPLLVGEGGVGVGDQEPAEGMLCLVFPGAEFPVIWLHESLISA